MANIESKVEKLIKPIIEKIGYQLYDVEYAKEGKNYFLRIFIDKDGGVDLKDCENVNDAISDILDDEDYIKEQYFLEVSSPGVERILRKDWHLKQNIGNNVSVKLFKKDENGKKDYQGELYEFDDDFITLSINNGNTNIEKIKIPRKNISQIKTIYAWD